jgi:hypothetical protein
MVYGGIVRRKLQKQQQAAMAQNEMAQSLGAANAAKPATPAQMPSLPRQRLTESKGPSSCASSQSTGS